MTDQFTSARMLITRLAKRKAKTTASSCGKTAYLRPVPPDADFHRLGQALPLCRQARPLGNRCRLVTRQPGVKLAQRIGGNPRPGARQ
ncbi:MAG: hypothetical protein VYE14_00210 [Verrucomicrobiota bacterium]|nr:hypothetical protein [Verrucomicrobiota bacterium]